MVKKERKRRKSRLIYTITFTQIAFCRDELKKRQRQQTICNNSGGLPTGLSKFTYHSTTIYEIASAAPAIWLLGRFHYP